MNVFSPRKAAVVIAWFGFYLAGWVPLSGAVQEQVISPAAAANLHIAIEKAGALQPLSVPAWDFSRQLWLPVKPAVEYLGGKVTWHVKRNQVLIQGPKGRTVAMTLNYPKVLLDGRRLARLPHAPRLWQGQVLVTPETLLALWCDLGGKNPEYSPETRTLRVGVKTPPVAAAVPAAQPSPAPLSLDLIVVDAGHGGRDPGAIGPTKLLEKNVTLEIARQVAEALEKKLGCKVVLTRSDDLFIPLAERSEIANRLKADLFVSIHANASLDRKANGSEVFIYNRAASSRKAAEIARFENRDVNYLEMIKDDLRQSVHEVDSITAAGLIGQELEKTGLGTRGIERAPFYVLAKSHMPSILVETAFISNPEEERKLRDQNFCQEIAAGIVRGLLQYNREKKPQVAKH